MLSGVFMRSTGTDIIDLEIEFDYSLPIYYLTQCWFTINEVPENDIQENLCQSHDIYRWSNTHM